MIIDKVWILYSTIRIFYKRLLYNMTFYFVNWQYVFLNIDTDYIPRFVSSTDSTIRHIILQSPGTSSAHALEVK